MKTWIPGAISEAAAVLMLTSGAFNAAYAIDQHNEMVRNDAFAELYDLQGNQEAAKTVHSWAEDNEANRDDAFRFMLMNNASAAGFAVSGVFLFLAAGRRRDEGQVEVTVETSPRRTLGRYVMTNPEEPRTIMMPQDLYEVFDNSVQESEGISFEELVAERPTDAYQYLRHMFSGFIDLTTNVRTAEGIDIAKDMDGEEATVAYAQDSLEKNMPATAYEPIDIVVSVVQNQSRWDAIRGRQPEVKQVAFHVEPPNLAF